MGALSWVRAARRVVGIAPQAEYHNLEALLESEENQPYEVYRILSYIIPPVIFIATSAPLVALSLRGHPLFLLGMMVSGAIAVGSWVLLDKLDRSIPTSKARIRKLAHGIWERYCGFSHIVGVDPAISPSVAVILEEASGIYLKHSAIERKNREHFSQFQEKAVQALEEAMAKMLELAVPSAIRAQELELSAGWAEPLLQEMRDMDVALDQHSQTLNTVHVAGSGNPIAGLREARLELERIEAAVVELQQRL
jgi:hypothetical protein